MKRRILYGIITCLLLLPVIASAENEAEVWVASPWQRVMRGSAPAGPPSASLFAASNEYEPFRLIIHNRGKEKLSGLRVEAGALKNGSHLVPAENIRLYRAYYLQISRPSKRTENPAGWYPDALIPFQNRERGNEAAGNEFIAAPFEVDTGQNAEVWCDLYVPAGTPPGMYRGKVTVFAGKRKLAVVPVDLTVRDFALPEKIAMRSNFGPLRDRNLEFMGLEPESPGARKLEALYHEALVSHRVMPGTPDHYWPEWNEADGITEKGEGSLLRELVEEKHVAALSLPLRHEDDPSACRAWLSAAGDWLRETGYLDLTYVYLEDEPNSAEEYEIVRRQGALIGSADPDIDRLCTEQTVPTKPEWGDLYGAVDIWCPLWGLWDEETARQRLEKGEELWSYTALCQGAAGTPWWQIDMDPLNFRAPFWLSWHYDITGFLYWSSTYWNAYGSPEGVWRSPHFRDDFWGEGMLLYPGKPAGIEGFVPSIRLKLIREALEEYEYMVMAAGLGHEEEVNRIVSAQVSDFQHWSRHPEDYSLARDRLAELIAGGTRQALVLGEGAKTRYQLIIPGDCGEVVRQSAGLIREAFLANGMDLQVAGEDRDDPSRPGIYLGDTEFARNQGIETSRFEGWSYLHKVAGRDLIIAGSNDSIHLGVVKGVCDFLREYAGTRFINPGKTGIEFLPTPVISVPADLDVVKTPWLRYMFAQGLMSGDYFSIANNQLPAGFKIYPHTWEYAIPVEKYFDHPGYSALVDGKRRFDLDKKVSELKSGEFKSIEQYCISNPKVPELIVRYCVDLADQGAEVVCVGMPDGYQICQCEDCYKLYDTGDDWTEKLWTFQLKLVEQIQELRPGTPVLLFAYDYTFFLPEHFNKFPDNTMIYVAQFDLWGDYIDRRFPEHHLLTEREYNLLGRWNEFEVPGGFVLHTKNWGSYFHASYLPNRTPSYFETQVKNIYYNEAAGIEKDATPYCIGLEGPSYYVWGRMFDDPENNRAEELLEEYYTAAFGEAAGPMRSFFGMFHRGLEFFAQWTAYNSPAQWYIPIDGKKPYRKVDDPLNWVRRCTSPFGSRGQNRHIDDPNPDQALRITYQPELLNGMEKELEQAEKIAVADKVKRRIGLIRMEFDYLKSIMRVIYLHNAWQVQPGTVSRERLLSALESWHALLDSYYDSEGNMKPMPGWPELSPFRGARRNGLGLVTARWWDRKEPGDNPFAWDIESIQ